MDMTADDGLVRSTRTVMYISKAGGDPLGHEAASQRALARKLAALRSSAFGGDYDADRPLPGASAAAPRRGQIPYFVPGDTLDAETAERLGVRGEQDLFGGVVPYAFVATKTITHGLIDPRAAAPRGWSAAFAGQVREVTLPGYSAFTLDDALRAGKRLLTEGAVRIKLAVGVGGLGQAVVRDVAALEDMLREFNSGEALGQGVVLEPNMAEIATYSVGRTHVGELVVTYYGQQRLTRDNSGSEVYGGSDLVLVRGDFDVLLARDLAPQVRGVLEQAGVYHTAALRCYPGLFASRCNYDVAQGRDEGGVPHSGVLEQSWRIGGATGAELAAIGAFLRDPELDTVRASTAEVYGDPPPIPAGAAIYFSGDDPRVGRLTKYAWIEGYGDT
jgi:hypothetical protein